MQKHLENSLKIIAFIFVGVLMSAIFPFDVFAQVSGISETIRSVGSGTNLPDYQAGHASQSYQPGASQLTSVIYFILDAVKYVFGGLAVAATVISALKLILAGRKADEAMTKEKETLRYSVAAILLILVADQAVRLAIYGEEGEVYRSAADMEAAAAQGSLLLGGVTNLLRVFMPSIAVLFFVFAGVRMMTAGTDSEKVNKAKKQMTWSVIGLILAGLTEVLVFRIIFPDQGARLMDAAAFNNLVVTMTNFISGFIAIIAVSMLIYAGYLYVVSQGQNLEKAKKAIFGAIIGLIIAMGAFALVNTFIKIENPTIVSAPEAVEATLNTNQ